MAAKPLITLGIRQKVHSGNEIRVWKNLWLPTIPARPAGPIAPIVHPMMSVRDLMIENPKIWDPKLLEHYVGPEDIPLVHKPRIPAGRVLLEVH